jgi:chromosome segregation ATPase
MQSTATTSVTALGTPEATDQSFEPSATFEQVLHHLSETMLATTEAVDILATRLDQLSEQVHQHECQLFAIGEDLKTLNHDQQNCLTRVDRLTQVLEGLAQSMLTTLQQS